MGLCDTIDQLKDSTIEEKDLEEFIQQARVFIGPQNALTDMQGSIYRYLAEKVQDYLVKLKGKEITEPEKK